VAQVAKEMNILTVAVVTKPFGFEGDKRMRLAEKGIEELSGYVDSLITIPNQKLLSVHSNLSLLDAFKEANKVLQGAVQGIAELITRPGLINVDFADVKTVMSEMGMAMMGTGSAQGENRAQIAASEAVSSPLLEDINISGAQGILVNVTAGTDLNIMELDEVGTTVKEFGHQVELEKPDIKSLVREIKLPERPDYEELDKPMVARRQQRAVGSDIVPNMHDEDFLDIPAFLRKQAD